MKIIQYYFLLILTLVLVYNAVSNNAQVSNVVLSNQDIVGNISTITFNVSWENSWRDMVNHDAVWVFVKYKRNSDANWSHADVGEVVAPGSFTSVSVTGGFFLYRNANGSGNVNLNGVQVNWFYGDNGVGDNELVQVKVFAIEMVYIPQGSFYVGDGGTYSGEFRNGGLNEPFQIVSEGSLTLGGTASGNLSEYGDLGSELDDFDNTTTTQTLPAAFPKGYAGFYIMKYEITQQQWVDFFNTLSPAQKTERDITGYDAQQYGKNSDTVSERNSISWTSGDASAGGRGDRACGFLSPLDGMAFADWAALRPMTELEYEKACRGDVYPVPLEYPWGSTVATAALALSGTENGTETVTTSGANSNGAAPTNFSGGDGGRGPVRVGIFAVSNSTRGSSGASYFGVMELSGNVSERAVSVGQASSRSFTGTHGDGTLTVEGDADVAGWPSWLGFRGGGYTGGRIISDRTFMNLTLASRYSDVGFRAVRTSGF